jgi:hypothetical protein
MPQVCSREHCCRHCNRLAGNRRAHRQDLDPIVPKVRCMPAPMWSTTTWVTDSHGEPTTRAGGSPRALVVGHVPSRRRAPASPDRTRPRRCHRDAGRNVPTAARAPPPSGGHGKGVGMVVFLLLVGSQVSHPHGHTIIPCPNASARTPRCVLFAGQAPRPQRVGTTPSTSGRPILSCPGLLGAIAIGTGVLLLPGHPPPRRAARRRRSRLVRDLRDRSHRRDTPTHLDGT